MNEEKWDKWGWMIPAALTALILAIAIPRWDYYMINFNTQKFPEVRSRMPFWIGEGARFIWDDVQTWDEYVRKKNEEPR